MIALIDNWFLDGDDRNVILTKVVGSRVDKCGAMQDIKENLYYSDVGSALTGLYKRLQRSCVAESTNLVDLSANLARIEAFIRDLGSKLDPTF